MRGYFGLLILLLLLPAWAMAQQLPPHHLKGYIAIAGGESFTYELVFTDSGGKIKGYSLTYLNEPNEVKSTITGTIDRAAGTLDFQEKDIVYNHNFQSNAVMCLIAANLQYKAEANGPSLKGHLTSNDYANASCTRGTITFMNPAELNDVFLNAPKTDTAVKPAPVVANKAAAPPAYRTRIVVENETPQRQQPAAVLQPDEVTAGKDKIYEWHANMLVIDLWDGGHIDGDEVTLRYNGQTILANYILTARKKRLEVPVADNGISELTIIAGDEGNEPPNTANLQLTDGDVHYDVIAYNRKGQQAVIKIKKANSKP